MEKQSNQSTKNERKNIYICSVPSKVFIETSVFCAIFSANRAASLECSPIISSDYVVSSYFLHKDSIKN